MSKYIVHNARLLLNGQVFAELRSVGRNRHSYFNHDDIQSALSQVGEVARDVASEYEDASSNWAGGNGNEEFDTSWENSSCNPPPLPS